MVLSYSTRGIPLRSNHHSTAIHYSLFAIHHFCMAVVYEERDALAFVRLARAERRNALTGAMLARLGEIFGGFARRRDLRAVILSGEGADFCAGDDGAELALLDAEGVRQRAVRRRAVCELVESCGVPVVVALRGAATGPGCELALACHLRVAGQDARFSLPEAQAYVMPPADSTSLKEPDVLTAEEALRLGLLNRVVAPREVLAEAEALARTIIDTGAPLAARACLEAVTRGARLPLEAGLRLEAELFSRLFSTTDAREGLAAFLEKRKPVFKGE